MPRSETRDKVMDLAEASMRHKGYSAVSFRDLAQDAGIKSSSIHYYFPQKHDLGVALVTRYGVRFMAKLSTETEGLSSKDSLRMFMTLHRQALDNDGGICLCGVFGAESAGLPEPITQAVSAFFATACDWLVPRLSGVDDPSPRATAYMVMSAVEGAMILATVEQDLSLFDRVAKRLEDCILA